MAGEWKELAVASSGPADRSTPVLRTTGNISSLSVSTLNTTTVSPHAVLKTRVEPAAGKFKLSQARETRFVHHPTSIR